jgi:pimeloyl-ACP methyl ester carboxylesterase
MRLRVTLCALASIAGLSTCWNVSFALDESVGHANDQEQQRLADLLVRPDCLESPGDSGRSYEVQAVAFASNGITLAGKLYSPSGEGKHPAVVFMHGGGNDYDQLMAAPRFYAPRFAHCGFAALIYDKRGTGESSGVFHESSRDDFIADAGNAAIFLSRHARIDSTRIGVYGGSEGGELAPVAAVRFPLIAAVISVSGPMGSAVEQANHNINYALRSRGYPDSLVDMVMPLWRRHHESWASRDPEEMAAVASEIVRLRETIDPFALPSTEQEIMSDSNLFFLRPGFNSMMCDYTGELSKLHVPLLAVYGELDPIVNVQKSVANLREQMTLGGNDKCEILVIEDVGHSFTNPQTGKGVPTINIYLNWLRETLGQP